MPIEIEVTDQLSQARASIKGDTNCWGSGKNKDEAVGDLVRTHPEKFGVKLIYTSQSALPRKGTRVER